MNKIITILLFSFVSVIVMGQTDPSQNFAGFCANSIEVNFTPFGNAGVISMNSLNFRRFIESDVAVRMGFSVDRKAWKTDNELVGDDAYVYKQSTFLFGLKPGIEKHLAGTGRLSPYIGAELEITFFRSKAEEISGDDTYEISGATDDDLSNRKYFYFGMGIIAGADYYFSKDIYLGAEVGLGFGTKTYGFVDITQGNTTTTVGDKTRESRIGQYYNPALRLGWKF